MHVTYAIAVVRGALRSKPPMTTPRFSIVLPVHRDGPALRRCLDACLGQDYPDFEVVVSADRPVAGLPESVLLVETGAVQDTSPAEKRDAAFGATSGDVLAYVDDDAYPRGTGSRLRRGSSPTAMPRRSAARA